jgi:hypothetical protein
MSTGAGVCACPMVVPSPPQRLRRSTIDFGVDETPRLMV